MARLTMNSPGIASSMARRAQHAAPPDTARFTPIPPARLADAVSGGDILVLDLRPPAAFAQARIQSALSITVPSTLLKRPGFKLEKVMDMLSTPDASRAFAKWASCRRIILYDSDSTQLAEGSNLLGLLRKFQAQGFSGELGWIPGGFSAVQTAAPNLLDDTDVVAGSPESPGSAGLRAHNLPSSAFQQSSTMSALRPSSFDIQDKRKGPSPTRTLAANPFYDNIRQNIELAQGITQKIPLTLPRHVLERKHDLPFQWLRDIANCAGNDEGTEALAMQFYRIELNEQRRLIGVMDYHSHETEMETTDLRQFPFSITAGFEKGTKNRYRNIWPFEHARVRLLGKSADDGSDYINASHVQPLCTNRQYIATQGPLPATYADFWTLCWEQDIRVIAMLTKQVEGNLAKCGSYWSDNSFGSLRLELLNSSGGSDEPEKSVQDRGFDFGISPTSSEPRAAPQTIRRTFRLYNTEEPTVKPRVITQLQFIEWPDQDVPETPAGILRFIKEVNVAIEKSGSRAPLLLHCSAGVGRTGGYIVVDAVLDGIRRELTRRRRSEDFESRRLSPEIPSPRRGLDLAAVGSSIRSLAERASLTTNSLTTLSSPRTFDSLEAQRGSAAQVPSSAGSLLPSSFQSTSSLPLPSHSITPPPQGSRFEFSPPREITSPPLINEERPSPPRLSSFEEPVRHILEDIREQRMSLCQTLRQYVFVHRAIIEGALELVDELKSQEKKAHVAHKRRASLTELLKEGKLGEPVLHKRPSMTMKKSSSQSIDQSHGRPTYASTKKTP